jgi:hypothetical protein
MHQVPPPFGPFSEERSDGGRGECARATLPIWRGDPSGPTCEDWDVAEPEDGDATTLSALAFGAFAVGSGIFLLLELSQPYTGLFRISPAALEQTLDTIDK